MFGGDQKNMFLAIALSAVVLLAWQFWFGIPQMEKQRQEAQRQAQQQQTQPQPQAGSDGRPVPQGTPGAAQAPGVPGAAPAQAAMTRDQALAASPRVAVETPLIKGTVALKGGRIDDLALLKYRETVDLKSPPVILLSPMGSPNAFYGEFGWTADPAANIAVPGTDTEWKQEGAGALAIGKPIVLTWDNGAGILFRRTIAVDENYLFTVKDEAENKSDKAVTLYPYALISRHGTPKTEGFYIQHEGLIGVLSEKAGESPKLQEVHYGDVEKKKEIKFDTVNGWLGITDKYWAATLLPDVKAHLKARFTADTVNNVKRYQTDYLLDGKAIAPGASASNESRLFAGAKEVAIIDAYEKALGLNKFELLIDWGWFHFVTKPMFVVIDWLYKFLGNFGLAILAVTVLVKAVFFPLANKSYASMAKMKAVQPEMMAIRDRFPDDKVKQQQAMMELYKKEKINPLAGCLPILIQIPVFFALYKVLFISIEMRHAPFFGWIKDLSAPDPTTVFNLFGLIPWDPSTVPVIGHFLMLGVWPLIMGVTMWVQMKMNPTPPDPTQKLIFDWMPVIFTFMLSSFAAGLVIYWAWNNLLSVLQQGAIMKKNGAKIELFDNIKSMFVKDKKASG
ncbi:membrane protein insertase YidC [Variibacter gotjawalensis]|uniref:Membrane protein insertase YidC n=1 Tax=Variibacter gotjawalensis TaxID=1333996 RepID=A0A0S3PP82_9BRAD|nr:membrane protein insertase YidC [Variibacter gotjawalensis]NIK48004.1 YidC/Oxa1 family membrane protein insertase [Variibacter gotjawalensis]RZS49881.1 protein translocase subunit yidC [Variibacter gotjawalensis]BAT57709.1 membrane protein insertase YidC [Variibacter gotjawalensis]